MSRRGRIQLVIGSLLLAGFAVILSSDWVMARKKSKPTPIADRRFDHAAHAASHKAKHGTDLKCSGSCHTTDADGRFVDGGRKAHARCQDCHTFFRKCTGSAKKQGVVCLTCHQNFKCVEGPKPDFAKLKTTFVATYSHKQHMRPGAASGKQCEGCHGEFGAAQPIRNGALAAGHKFCSGCHERGVEPLMADCRSCHVDRKSEAGKVPVALPRVASKYATTGRFDHKRHARADRVGTKGRECLTCHANIGTSKNTKRVPLPTMQGCYKTCHNGSKAFSATGATCTRCHAGGKK